MSTWVLAASSILSREDANGIALAQALASIHNRPRAVLQGRYYIGELLDRAAPLIERFVLEPEIVRDYRTKQGQEEDLSAVVKRILPELFALLGDPEFSGLIVMPEGLLRAIKATPHWRIMDGSEYEGETQFTNDCAIIGLVAVDLADAQSQLRGIML